MPPTVNRNIQAEQRNVADNRMVYHHRERVTLAELNAGKVILPANSYYKYRLVDVALIAVGGAVTAATTVDILATRAGVSVKLLAAAVAGLTENALLRAGAANAAILAGG